MIIKKWSNYSHEFMNESKVIKKYNKYWSIRVEDTEVLSV